MKCFDSFGKNALTLLNVLICYGKNICDGDPQIIISIRSIEII